MPDRLYRRLRIIEYVGTQDWVDTCVNTRMVKGRYVCPSGVIRETMLGETSELLEAELPSHVNPNNLNPIRSGTALKQQYSIGQSVRWYRPDID